MHGDDCILLPADAVLAVDTDVLNVMDSIGGVCILVMIFVGAGIVNGEINELNLITLASSSRFTLMIVLVGSLVLFLCLPFCFPSFYLFHFLFLVFYIYFVVAVIRSCVMFSCVSCIRIGVWRFMPERFPDIF